MKELNLFTCMTEAVEWSELAELPYTDKTTIGKKEKIFAEESKELSNAKSATVPPDAFEVIYNTHDIIDGHFDKLFTALNLNITQGNISDCEIYFEEFLAGCEDLNFDPYLVWEEGMRSNMSKFPLHNLTDYAVQQRFFREMGLKYIWQTKNCRSVFASLEDQKDVNGKKYFKGKILKPSTFSEPHWSRCYEEKPC